MARRRRFPPNQRRSMDWLFRSRRAEPKGGADLPASTGNAERALRALLAASIILPILIFSGVAWIAYRQHFKDSHNRFETMLSVVYEHALKVFETFELAAKYTDELFEDVTDEQLIASEADYHARLKVLTDTLPQLRDIWVIDRNGHPLVSGTIFPMPHHLDLSDRDHFVFHKNNAASGMFISDVIDSRAADRRVIVIARRRSHRSQRVPRNHDDGDRAGIFRRLLFDAAAATQRHRRARARGRRHPGPPSGSWRPARPIGAADADFRANLRIAAKRNPDRGLAVRRRRAHHRLPPAAASRHLRGGRRGDSYHRPRLDAGDAEPCVLRHPRHHHHGLAGLDRAPPYAAGIDGLRAAAP